MKKPAWLYLALSILFFYISLDLYLTFFDSRSNAQAVLLAFIVYPAIVACAMGNHFGYFFCLLLSGLLLFAPIFAMANAPDRLLTPADIPIALILLFLFLRKPVRDYFKQQRKDWQNKQASKLQAYDHLTPVFNTGKQFYERTANQLFWRDGSEYFMFINASGASRAHRLNNLAHAESIRAYWLKLLGLHKKIFVVVGLLLVGGFSVFSVVAHGSGEEHNQYIVIPVFIGILLGSIVPLLQARYLSKLKRELPKMDLTIKPMQLAELYASRNKKHQQKTQKMALVSVSVFMAVMILFGLLVSPKIMEKRRADMDLQASTEMVQE